MGARNVDNEPGPVRLYLQRVPFVDGDYAPDGTYWGGGRGTEPLWAAFTPSLSVCIYVRACTRAVAARAVQQEDRTGHTFHRAAPLHGRTASI
jgi:hypothetical protein